MHIENCGSRGWGGGDRKERVLWYFPLRPIGKHKTREEEEIANDSVRDVSS